MARTNSDVFGELSLGHSDARRMPPRLAKKKSDMSICQFLVEYPMAQEAGGIATEVWFQLRWKVHEIHAVRPLFIFAQRAHLESLLAAL